MNQNKNITNQIKELQHNETKILLQNLISSGTLNPSEIETILYMSKKSEVNKVHTAKIGTRSDGRFYTYLYIKGERKQKTFDSEKNLYQFLYEHYFGKNKLSLEDIYPEFMVYRRNKGKVSPKTLEENKNFWNRFLKDHPLTRRPISDITVRDYIDFFETLTKDGTYTAKCIGNLKSLLNKMYDYAIREEIVEYNPIKNVDFKEFNYYVPFNDDKVYKTKERNTLLNYLADKKEPYALAIRLMFQLTVRIGELKSFRFDDVDFEERTIAISKQALSIRTMNDDLTFSSATTTVVNHTKKNTPQGKRKLRLTQEAINIIQTAREINPDGEYLFMPFGHIMRTDKFNEYLKRYTTACGVPYYSSHKIRFTSASNLYNGKNLTQVSRALGHSQVATTLHYFRNIDCDDDLLEQMENAFKIN